MQRERVTELHSCANIMTSNALDSHSGFSIIMSFQCSSLKTEKVISVLKREKVIGVLLEHGDETKNKKFCEMKSYMVSVSKGTGSSSLTHSRGLRYI